MAAVTDINEMTYYLNGEPFKTMSNSSIITGDLEYFINGEPLLVLIPQLQKKLGQYFFTFF